MALPLLMRLSLSLYLPFFHFPLRFLHTSVCFLYHSLINLFHFHIIRPLPFTTNSISVTKISHNISLFRVCFVPFFFLLFPCFFPISRSSIFLPSSSSPSPRHPAPSPRPLRLQYVSCHSQTSGHFTHSSLLQSSSALSRALGRGRRSSFRV